MFLVGAALAAVDEPRTDQPVAVEQPAKAPAKDAKALQQQIRNVETQMQLLAYAVAGISGKIQELQQQASIYTTRYQELQQQLDELRLQVETNP